MCIIRCSGREVCGVWCVVCLGKWECVSVAVDPCPSVSLPDPQSSTIIHYQPSTIINHHQSSSTINRHQPSHHHQSSHITNHYQSSPTINHHRPPEEPDVIEHQTSDSAPSTATFRPAIACGGTAAKGTKESLRAVVSSSVVASMMEFWREF